ncbi:MAG: DinB family protein [Acidobacteriota bacterium]
MTSVFSNRATSAAAGAEEYRRVMLGQLDGRPPLEILGELPSAIEELTREAPGELLSRPEAEGKWSVAQVVQHLADSELIYGCRLRMVIAQDRPRIVGFDQDLFATRLHYENTVLKDALQVLTTVRVANLRLLTSLSPEAFQRVGEHEERGEESLDLMCRLCAAHDLMHRRQIARILLAVGAS